jgi:hypothetical protein
MNNDDSRDKTMNGDLTLVVKRARIRVSSGLKTGKCPGPSDPSIGDYVIARSNCLTYMCSAPAPTSACGSQ